LPEEHGTHDVSVDAEPATDPTPAAHDGLECAAHVVLVSSLALNRPEAQSEQVELSATFDPSVYFLPRPHLVIVLSEHDDLSEAALYVPTPQLAHEASSAEDVPSV
jgi:hypothetical protein